MFCSFFLFAEAFYIQHFDIKIEINEEGYFDVTETIDVVFTEKRRGIIREIPRVILIDGKKHSIKFDNIKVDDWKIKTSRKNGIQFIRIGSKNTYVNGSQQYVIHYRVHKAFLFLEDHTEFHWNMTGQRWDVPIHNISYNITFPTQIELTNNDFFIASGKKDVNNNKAIVNFENHTLVGESTEMLNPNEGISIAINLPKDYVARPIPPPPPVPFQERNPLLALPIAFFGMIITWWRTRGRRRKPSISDDEFEYYPPDELTPSETSAFFDRKPDTDDLVALIPMWARMGYLRVQGGKENDGGLRFEKIEDIPAHAPDYEQTVFNALFSTTDAIFLPDLKEKLYTSMHKAKTQLGKSIRKKDYLFDNDSIRLFHSGWMIALGFILIIAGVLTLIFTKGVVTGILLIVSSFAPFIIHFLRPKMSLEGEEMYIKIHRFKNFLKSNSTDHVNKLLEDDPNYFEKMLPYAVAFGLDTTFTQKFEHSLDHAPSWFIMDGMIHNQHSNSVSAFSSFSKQFQPTEIKQVFNSSPAPTDHGGGSSGGSFSGGSGGGFGGGGGSSW